MPALLPTACSSTALPGSSPGLQKVEHPTTRRYHTNDFTKAKQISTTRRDQFDLVFLPRNAEKLLDIGRRECDGLLLRDRPVCLERGL